MKIESVMLGIDKRIWAVLADLCILGACVFYRSLIELSKRLFPVCAFRAVTGVLCPICGGTHAVECLFRGDVAGAVRYNSYVLVLGIYALVILIAWNVYCFWENDRAKRLLRNLVHYRVVIALGILAGIFMVVHNIVLFLAG